MKARKRGQVRASLVTEPQVSSAVLLSRCEMVLQVMERKTKEGGDHVVQIVKLFAKLSDATNNIQDNDCPVSHTNGRMSFLLRQQRGRSKDYRVIRKIIL